MLTLLMEVTCELVAPSSYFCIDIFYFCERNEFLHKHLVFIVLSPIKILCFKMLSSFPSSCKKVCRKDEVHIEVIHQELNDSYKLVDISCRVRITSTSCVRSRIVYMHLSCEQLYSLQT